PLRLPSGPPSGRFLPSGSLPSPRRRWHPEDREPSSACRHLRQKARSRRGRVSLNPSPALSAHWRDRSLNYSRRWRNAAPLFHFGYGFADVVAQLLRIGLVLDGFQLLVTELEKPLPARIALGRQGAPVGRQAVVQLAISPVTRFDHVRDHDRGADQPLGRRSAFTALRTGKIRQRNEPLELVALAAFEIVKGHQALS